MRIRILFSREINDNLWFRHFNQITEESSAEVVLRVTVLFAQQASPQLQELYGLYSETAVAALLGKPTKNSISA